MGVAGHPGRRYGRRAFLKLVLGVGTALLGGQVARQQGWLPAGLSASRDDDMARYAEGPSPVPRAGAGPPVVAIVRGDDPAAMVRRAVALAGGLDRIMRPGTMVLIKPNLTIPSPSGQGNVSDSRVLQATIELCRQAGASRIVVGDGPGGGDAEQIMRQAGYESVLKATGATFLDLNGDEVVTRRLTDPAALAEYRLAKTAAEAPVLISLAVLKVHSEAIVSLCCKNLMGITARKVYGRPRHQLHSAGVQRVIADIVRLRTPDFAIIDGTVGLEGDSPMHGTPVPMNLIIAGRSPVSVDAVGAAVMGFDPQQLEQLTLLAKRGIGEIDPAKISVQGSAIASVQRRFRR